MVYEKVKRCFDVIRQKTDFQPAVGIVLGSGLGGFADNIQVEAEISYGEIEDFPVSTVAGHAGKFIFGYLQDKPVVCMKGRVHYYEGYAVSDVVLPVRLMHLMGVKTLFLTNAAGGIQSGMKAGDFGIPIKEGVYAQLTGPSYESPAEIRLLKILGADAVGMSTAVEAITANHMGMKVCAISCISNLAAGLNENPLTHTEVQEAADKAAPLFQKLVTESILRF